MIEQVIFTYSPLGVWKTNKKIEDQGEKQVKAIQDQVRVKII